MALVDDSVLVGFIAIQRNAIRYNILFAIVVALAGILVILFGHWFGTTTSTGMEPISGIGGLLVSSLSGFRINEILHRREKIQTVQIFQLKIQSGIATNQITQEERQKLEGLLWKATEKSILG